MRYREEVLERQIEQERMTWAAMEIFASLCVLSRRDAELRGDIPSDPANESLANLFLEESAANVTRQLAAAGHSNDDFLRSAAQAVLKDR
jgi:hypothetical protein